MLGCRSELHSPEEKHHEHRMAVRNTHHQCKERQGMFRKGGRGTHQQHRNALGGLPGYFLPVSLVRLSTSRHGTYVWK